MKEAGIRMPVVVEKFNKLCSQATIYRHANKALGQPSRTDQRKTNKGRPRKLSIREESKIIRSIPALRKEEGSFTSKRIAGYVGFSLCGHKLIRKSLIL